MEKKRKREREKKKKREKEKKRRREKEKNPEHIYSLINHRRTTVNLSNHIFCEN